MRWIVLMLTGLLLTACGAGAADRVGDGVELDWNPPGPPAVTPAQAKVEPPVPTPIEPAVTKVEPPVVARIEPEPPTPVPVDSSPLKQAPTVVIPPTEDSKVPLAVAPLEPVEPLAPLPLASMPGPGEAPAAPQPVDVANDLPGTVAAQRTSPFHVEMEDFTAAGNLSPKAEKTMLSVAEMKRLVGLLSRDLDTGGMERTRLIFNAESLAKEVSTMAELWNDVPPLVSSCVNTKRTALVLEEELQNEPRQWSHVRWAFQGCQNEVKQLRQIAARLAGSEPRMVRVEKKGKVTYVEAPRDAEQIQRELEEKRKQELADERDKNRERAAELKKTKEQIQLNYDR